MKLLQCVRDGVAPECLRCGKRYFALANHSRKLNRLKTVCAYRPEYASFTRLCKPCWIEIRTRPCSLCSSQFNVLKDNRDSLLENLKKHGVSLFDVEIAKHVCPNCGKLLRRSACMRCKEVFLSKDNRASTYRDNPEIAQWLYPYSEYYSTSWDSLCPQCDKKARSACADVQKRIKHWAGESRSEFLHGFRTVKTLGRVRYDGYGCSEPAQVESYLKLYSAQLGGNGLVKYYWEKHEERHSEQVLAGYSKNNNPYYKTEYSTERWFTGYATAVLVQPFR